MTPFRSEVDEMPAALARAAAWYRGEGRAALRELSARAAGATEAVFTGMGTSCFAPESEFPRLARAGLLCRAVDAGEWLHAETSLPCRGLTVLTSQSGESVELVRLVEHGLVPKGYVAITNDPSSTLARAAGLVLPLHAGAERSISNKTYANTLAVLSLLAAAVEGSSAVDAALDDLARAADALTSAPDVGAAARLLAAGTGIAFVGRGAAFVTARQCALTFMEGARLLSAAFAGGAFNHGPFETVDASFRLVIFQAHAATRALAEGLAARAAALGAGVVLVGTPPLSAPSGVRTLPVPAGPEALFPLLVSRVQNLLLASVADARGHEAGIFRYGSKVTTHE
jgi:glutamine---fructose-6-phosphate transaminase (isomerizing)